MQEDQGEFAAPRYRELVTDRANSLLSKGTTAWRDISKWHPEVHACEREIERFYLRFPKPSIPVAARAVEYLAAAEEFESLLLRWKHERAAQIAEKETSRCRDKEPWLLWWSSEADE